MMMMMMMKETLLEPISLFFCLFFFFLIRKLKIQVKRSLKVLLISELLFLFLGRTEPLFHQFQNVL